MTLFDRNPYTNEVLWFARFAATPMNVSHAIVLAFVATRKRKPREVDTDGVDDTMEERTIKGERKDLLVRNDLEWGFLCN